MLTRQPFRLASIAAPKCVFAPQIRCLHRGLAAKPVPSPTPFVPDTQTFLTLIGRNLSQHAAKIPSWEALFSLSSQQLKDAGIEPARSRRYLLHWRNKFRNGEFGIGGDLTEIHNGKAELRIVEVPIEGRGSEQRTATLTSSPGMKKIVVNVAPGQEKPSVPLTEAKPVGMVKIKRASVIAGPYVDHKSGKSGAAVIRIQEGLWEQRRGHKVDGGERRKAEVRSKRRAAERKAGKA
ncbi:hypothetical protein MBLNU457_3694t1 [Dothideomycetes sp. NU457]